MTVPTTRLVLGTNSRFWIEAVALLALPMKRYDPGLVLVKRFAARLLLLKVPAVTATATVTLRFCAAAETVTNASGCNGVTKASDSGCCGGTPTKGAPLTAATR